MPNKGDLFVVNIGGLFLINNEVRYNLVKGEVITLVSTDIYKTHEGLMGSLLPGTPIYPLDIGDEPDYSEVFIRYECGCIALRSEGMSIIVKSCCCNDEREFVISMTGPENKRFYPLTVHEENEILEHLATLISQGYQFRELKNLLS